MGPSEGMFFLQIRGRHLYKLVCSIIASYELSRRYLKEKESTDKLDTLKSPTTPLSHRTAIPTWLANLDLSKYEDLFSAKSLFVIDDLEGVINKKFLRSLGISEEDTCKMLDSYLSWFDVFNAQRQSSLSSHSSSIRIQRTRVRSSAVRFTP
uniref:SAM domain-containing protein n=1 Tax=Ascaris lumbricoides TaxID=6252 RepID=A0A0M3ISK7_ASCLU